MQRLDLFDQHQSLCWVGLVWNAKSADSIALDRLVSKYALHTAVSLLKLKSEFQNSKLESIEKVLDKWILNFEGLQIQMNEFMLKGNIAEKDFMIHVLNNFPKEYGTILDGLKKLPHNKWG